MSAVSPTLSNRWIVNRPLDLLLAGSGVAFFVYAVAALFAHGAPASGLAGLAGLLAVVGNAPHFMASYVRLYGNRETRRAHPFVAFLAPVLLALGVCGTFLSPRGIGSWFIKAHLIWSGYHYSGQTYGVSLLYCRKRGIGLKDWEKWILLGPIAFSYLLPTIRFEIGTTGSTFYTIPYPTLGSALHDAFGLTLPQWLGTAMQWGYVAAIALLLGWLVFRARRGVPVPLPALLVIAAQMLWFTVVGANPTFTLFVPLFHSLQYLLIVVAFHRPDWSRLAQPLKTVFWRYYGLLVLLGLFLFGAVPGILSQYGCDRQIAYAAVITFINLHHYMIDGVIWKLRKPELRRVLIEQAELAA